MQVGHLPSSNDINIGTISGIFSNVTNSYKFYWLLAILDGLKEQRVKTLRIEWLLCRMVASVWYPVNYFRLKFGKSDKLSIVAEMVKEQCNLPIDASVDVVAAACQSLPIHSTARRELEEKSRYVPFRFIRPFFEVETRGLKDHKVNNRIAELASDSFLSASPSMYRVVGDHIELADAWFVYLTEHLAIIRGFCNWHLILYLQSNNPTVGNISGKLDPPGMRDLKVARRFWEIALKREPHKCIYSGRDVPYVGFSLDHFLPWSFVAHDALWNICPTVADVNSSKGDRLPSVDHYLTAFIKLQFDAVRNVVETDSKFTLDDYTLLFGVASTSEVKEIPLQQFQEKLENLIRPQLQVATNCGFSPGWTYWQ